MPASASTMEFKNRRKELMKITNVIGTAGETCSCDSWLDHWEKFSGRTASVCGVITCSNNNDLVGAHVMKVGGYDFATYIYPLCSACNQARGVLDAWDGYPLVSADKSQTCEQ